MSSYCSLPLPVSVRESTADQKHSLAAQGKTTRRRKPTTPGNRFLHQVTQSELHHTSQKHQRVSATVGSWAGMWLRTRGRQMEPCPHPQRGQRVRGGVTARLRWSHADPLGLTHYNRPTLLLSSGGRWTHSSTGQSSVRCFGNWRRRTGRGEREMRERG